MERKFSQITMEFVGEEEKQSPQNETAIEVDPSNPERKSFNN